MLGIFDVVFFVDFLFEFVFVDFFFRNLLYKFFKLVFSGLVFGFFIGV